MLFTPVLSLLSFSFYVWPSQPANSEFPFGRFPLINPCSLSSLLAVNLELLSIRTAITKRLPNHILQTAPVVILIIRRCHKSWPMDLPANDFFCQDVPAAGKTRYWGKQFGGLRGNCSGGRGAGMGEEHQNGKAPSSIKPKGPWFPPKRWQSLFSIVYSSRPRGAVLWPSPF